MQFDLFSLMQKRDESWSARGVFEDVAEQLRVAEQAGFGTAWFGEHHFSNYSLCPSPLMACAWMAGRTSRIRLGPAVVVAPLYEPIRLVQELGLVDVLSDGRLVLGLGSGYQDYEFERFRTPLGEAVDRTLEILDIIELALTRDSFSYDGRFYRYPETQVAVKRANAMPETWVAGLMGHPKVQRRVAESGYAPMLAPGFSHVSVLTKARDAYRQLYRDIGRDPAELPLGLMRFVHVTDDRAEALEATERARYSSRVSLALRLGYCKLDGIYAEDTPAKDEPGLEEMCDRNYIIGPADYCVERILDDHEVMGHTHLLANLQLGGIPHARVMRSLDAFAEKVMPAVDTALGERGATMPVMRQRPLAPGAAAA